MAAPHTSRDSPRTWPRRGIQELLAAMQDPFSKMVDPGGTRNLPETPSGDGNDN
jgi:hypothetical protein